MSAHSVGAVVAVYGAEPREVSYEVEFVAANGETLGVVTLNETDLVPFD
ncbi:DUF4926 domain-containing protein [Nocardia fusca]